MKTIKIALMSTLLMMCFMHMSQAQIVQLPHYMTNVSVTAIGNGQVSVEYGIIGPNTAALTRVKLDNLTVVYSDMVSGGDAVSTVFTVPIKNNSPRVVDISCELYQANGNLIKREYTLTVYP